MTSADPADRFSGLSRPAALAVLLALAVAIAVGLALPPRPPPRLQRGNHSDIQLYDKVIAAMRAGAPYDQAVVKVYRASGAPLRPFLAVRPPLLADLIAPLPNSTIADLLLSALAWAVIGVWAFRLKDLRPGRAWLAWVPLVVFTGVAASMPLERMGVLQETWTGLLIVLSLALRTDRRFLAAAFVGLLAALIRELAMPYLLVMAVMALVERRRGEAAAFAAALLAALMALAWHAWTIVHLTTPADVASPGWLRLAGWRFVLETARWNILAFHVSWLGAILVPLSLLGALGRGDPLGRRLSALVAGYLAGLMVFGRPENYYWGLVTAPILALGLCFAPLALADLGRAALRPRRSARAA